MPVHHPPHIYLDNAWYIISASTLDRVPLLRSERAKAFVRDKLNALIPEFGIALRAWVILDNHYHLLLRTRLGQELPRLLRRLHGSVSRQVNEWDGINGRQVWHNYWDTSIRDEAGLWTRFNYVHQNPVKHGYVDSPEDWPFSSYVYYLRTRGTDWLADCWRRYPVIDFLEGDGFDEKAG